MGEAEMRFQNHQITHIELPFTPEQRYHQFRMMMWSYSTLFITPEDQAAAARPKKGLFGFGAAYAVAIAYLKYQ